MNLIRYRPVTKSLIDWDFDTVLNRFFSESFKHSDAGFPKVDVSVDENRYLVEANLPGLTEKNVDVKVDGDLLTISSIEKEEKKENAKEYIIRERHDAEFSPSQRHRQGQH